MDNELEESEDIEDQEWENWNEILDDEDKTNLKIEKAFKK